MTVRAVLFDLDDTLFAHNESVRAAVLAHRLSHDVLAAADEAEEWERWHSLEEHHYHRFLSGELDLWSQRRARVRDFVAPFGIEFDDDAADAWYLGFYDRYREAWHLHADAIPAMDAIAAQVPGVRFGIITNAVLSEQQQKLVALDAVDRFDAVIASGEVGFAKPDPRIFAAGVAEFGVDPSEAVYIGDRLQTDALGAIAAGLTGVWIDRPGVATPAELERAAEAGARVIRTLDELPPLVARL